MSHHCHAYGCEVTVHPKFLMCPRHWRLVNPKIQKLVWATYRPGQEIDKQPSRGYLLAQRSAVWCVFVAEGGCTWQDVPEVGSEAFMLGPGVLKENTA